jgi:enamine deaminase RidA (YjgF/YER057c/UK114 family)
MTERQRISSGGPWEESGGYSRAIVAGDTCYVSGTTDAGPGGRSLHPGDVAAQAHAAWDIVAAALEQAEFGWEDTVRTRMYVIRPEDAPLVAAVHGERFGSVRPAATLVVVAALVDPSLLVEVELEARRG